MLNDFCTIAERLAVSSLDISEKNVGTIHEFYSEKVGIVHDLYSENVGIIHELYSENVGIIHELHSENVGTIHELYSENVGIINKFYSKNVGTVHELSLPRISGYAYLIFGDIHSLLYHFSKVMAEMVNCPHPQSLSQKGRGARG